MIITESVIGTIRNIPVVFSENTDAWPVTINITDPDANQTISPEEGTTVFFSSNHPEIRTLIEES